LVMILFVFAGCETEQEVRCYPQRISTKGDAGATSITADFKYLNDTLDRIIWSNYQEHYYSYNDSRKLIKVSRKNVLTLKKKRVRTNVRGWTGIQEK